METKETPKKATTVLFIDDEELMRDVASMMFEDLGWKPLIAPNGKAGVDLYQQNSGEIDLTIIDFSMPGMNGIDTAQAIMNVNEFARIIMTSGLITRKDVAPLSSDENPVGFIAKPFHFQELVQCISEHWPEIDVTQL